MGLCPSLVERNTSPERGSKLYNSINFIWVPPTTGGECNSFFTSGELSVPYYTVVRQDRWFSDMGVPVLDPKFGMGLERSMISLD